ncbi:GAF domain-containing protein [Actinokineospora sp. UTMC 2448]|uniref:helix-turn-helix domain-containing protein n=1 Tax=Actinokineospora sp. UTMC 2448 TaxID=2268449 RepID=UPI002164EAE5|nr:GAF domain-containing protein [Actinokineospora sp. UTMC 2448]UVS82363.1 fused phosphoenolpyruvate-protein phosphotransferase PtsP/GAF domain protein [Actinokineospora sp. UTMC 2448]
MARVEDAAVESAVAGLLALLADGAGGDRLAQVVIAARAAGVDGAELAALERATEDALRVRATVAAHQRREAELAALFDTASDLAQLRDTDAVLRSIVHRARMLLGVDVSYLSMNDERSGITYMRVTDGSASALFQQVTLGMGEGLGGLVAQTARPYATRDYFADSRFKHTSPIDSSVKDEGLRAILGVPLALGSKVIGVLYAADRTPRDFAAEEVALLSSLADHAAIAIDNAHLLDETRLALADLNRAHETISAHNAAMRRAEDAHDRLMDLVLRGGDLSSVAAAVGDVLHGGIAVYDASGSVLAAVGECAGPSADAVAASRRTGRAVSTGDSWVCAVLAGPEPLGSLVLSGRPVLDDADRRLFERAGVVTALLLMLRRSVAAAEDEVRGELLTDLLTAPDRNPAALVDRGRRVGVDLTASYAVLVATADHVPRRRLAMAAARYGVLAGVHAEQVVVLARDAAPGALAARMARELGADGPVTVGAAGPASGPAGLAEAYAAAARCARSLIALGRAGEGGSAADLGFVGLLLGDGADLATYVRDTLGPVLDYDARRGTDLVRTLEAYFSCGTNLTRAKEVLHVHVNTVVQRLERIGALLGPDWQEPARALEIHLALRVHRLSR